MLIIMIIVVPRAFGLLIRCGFNCVIACAIAVVLWLAFGPQGDGDADAEILHASYDGTRELFAEVNAAFQAWYAQHYGKVVRVRMSHGGSASQVQAVLNGLDVDVISVAVPADLDRLIEAGLVQLQQMQANRLPPFYDTVVLVVRRGNPLNIRDWLDLAKPGMDVVMPSPRSSGAARWILLAIWAGLREYAESDKQAILASILGNVQRWEVSSRTAAVRFFRRRQGDVIVTWLHDALALTGGIENDAEVIYPRTSIRAEPAIAVVDRAARRKGTLEVARVYVEFLYRPEAQTIIERHYYTPAQPGQIRPDSPPLVLQTVEQVFGSWQAAHRLLFAPGALFDRCTRTH